VNETWHKYTNIQHMTGHCQKDFQCQRSVSNRVNSKV